MKLKELCDSLERQLPLSNAEIFEPYTIPDDYPWKDKTTDDTNMYACLYGLAEYEGCGLSILEIGTGWGISGLMWQRALELEGGRFCTLDCGGFEEEDSLRKAWRLLGGNRPASVEWDYIKFNTQTMYTNHKEPERRPWIGPIDILFIDGDHGCKERPWALFSDLWRFWPLLKPGGLCVCDDLHCPYDYPAERFPWLPYTWDSFWRFRHMMVDQIEDSYIWKYPFVPSGKRPVGLLRKKL